VQLLHVDAAAVHGSAGPAQSLVRHAQSVHELPVGPVEVPVAQLLVARQ
jgi:hypothetical protein